MNNKELGKFGEEIAAKYLIEEGYEIMARNFTSRVGEVDIVASKDRNLHFCEVKMRSNDVCGRPAEAVNKKKREKIRKVAAVYLMREKGHSYNIEFDVIEVYCNHIKNAF